MSTTSHNPGFDFDVMTAALARLDTTPLDGSHKGIPSATSAITSADIANHHWNLLDGNLAAPVAFIRKSALDANAAWMNRLLQHFQLQLAPHAKTTMCPHIFAHQARHGSWGLTVATVQQARVAVSFGCTRLIIANQVIGTAQLKGLFALLRLHTSLVIHVFVDSVEGIRQIAHELGADRFPQLRLLIDVGFVGGRTGIRDLLQVKDLVSEIAQSNLRLGGIGGYEGVISAPSGAEDVAAVERYFDFFESVATAADKLGAFDGDSIILTAGGSTYYDIVGPRLSHIRLSKPTQRVLRSGCYATHDCGTYVDHLSQMRRREPALCQALGDLEPALFVAGLVQSRPEARLALLTMGKRDVGFDEQLPVPVWQHRAEFGRTPRDCPAGWTISQLKDQHAYLRIPADADVQVGDLICCGVSHPCSTFDRWRLIHLVDDAWTSLGVMPTYF